MTGEIQTNAGEPDITADIQSVSFVSCVSSFGSFPLDITANATKTEPWQLQIQQPEGNKAGETPGQITLISCPPKTKSNTPSKLNSTGSRLELVSFRPKASN